MSNRGPYIPVSRGLTLKRDGMRIGKAVRENWFRLRWSKTMAREDLKWQEAAFKADLEKLLKKEGHMPEDKHLLMSRKGKRLGVAYVSTPRGEKRPWVQATRNSASCETMFARCKVAISSKEGHYMGSRRYSRRLGMCEQSGGSW
jgi:hypothetical protein